MRNDIKFYETLILNEKLNNYYFIFYFELEIGDM